MSERFCQVVLMTSSLLAALGCAGKGIVHSGDAAERSQERTATAPGPEAPIEIRRGGQAEQAKPSRELAEQEKLSRADKESRPAIASAKENARTARNDFARAHGLFRDEKLPPQVVRPTQEEVDALYKKAKAARDHYDSLLTAQVNRYEEFLKRYPQNWYARHRFAWFLADHVIWQKAAEEWRKVIELKPDFPYAYNNLASLYNHMGRDMEAIDLYRKAIELRDDDPTFHMNLADNYSLHRKEVAAKFGWDAPRVFRESVAEYRRARELVPNDPQIARRLAAHYVHAGYFGVEDVADEQIAAWEYYLKLDLTPHQRGVGCRNLGRIYLRQKKSPATALGWLEKSVELLDDPASHKMLNQAKAEIEKQGGRAEPDRASGQQQRKDTDNERPARRQR